MERRYVIPIFLIVFVNFLGAGVVLPTLPLYAQINFDASPQAISMLLASYYVAQFFAAPVLGRLSDKYGRLPVLIISQIGTFLSFLMLAGAQTLPILFAGRILDGITGGNVIVAQAYLTDIAPKEKRTQALGIVFSAFGLGYILGPAIGGIMTSILPDEYAFYLGAAISLASVVIGWVMLPESLPKEKRAQRRATGQTKITVQDVLANHTLLLIMGIAFVAQFSIALLVSTLALYGEEVIFKGLTIDEAQLGNGLLMVGFGAGQVIAQAVVMRPLVTRFREHRAVIIGAVFRSLSMFAIVVITTPLWVGGFALPVLGMASGIMMPPLQTLATLSVPEEVNGGALGWYLSMASIGTIAGNALGGVLFAENPMLPYMVAGTMLALSVIPSTILMRRGKAGEVVAVAAA